MAKMLSQNYSYAINSNGELVNVSVAQRDEKYFCPICGENMTPHMGKIRRWHFVHKNVENCSYESYLHNLAKVRIREAFLSSDKFLLSYQAKALCTHSCPFMGFPKCVGEKAVEFDLRKFYDKCELEESYNQFRADVLLSSSTNSKRPPILIEIMVTHKCTAEKIKDGVRIIEIPIHSEADIDNIVTTCRITATRDSKLTNIHSEKENIITLYNFNKVEDFDPASHYEEYEDNEDYYVRKDTIVFLLNQHGSFRTFNCHCFEVHSKIPPNVHYYITQAATPFKEIFQGFSKRGVGIRNCFLCKFSQQDMLGDRLCVLYKKHSLPRKPSPYNATSCPHYREDYETSQFLGFMGRNIKDLGVRYYYHICNEIL